MWELLNVSLGMNSFCLSPAYSKGIIHSKHMTQFKAVCVFAFSPNVFVCLPIHQCFEFSGFWHGRSYL